MINSDNLGHIDTWIFDLDNTLYHPRVNLFAQIDARMGRYISDAFGLTPEAAKALQKRYFQDYGTTLRGLMETHGIAPQTFLDFVHDVDMSAVPHDAPLAQALATLPGRKFVFTNADTRYAVRVLDRLGLATSFDGIHCILATGLQPKPRQIAYDSLIAAHAITPKTSIFFEDMAINLQPAKAMGMTTVWVANDSPWAGAAPSDQTHIDYKIDDVSACLSGLNLKAAG
jgi:putative hydrolase of the HAD superfamily